MLHCGWGKHDRHLEATLNPWIELVLLRATFNPRDIILLNALERVKDLFKENSREWDEQLLHRVFA